MPELVSLLEDEVSSVDVSIFLSSSSIIISDDINLLFSFGKGVLVFAELYIYPKINKYNSKMKHVQ